MKFLNPWINTSFKKDEDGNELFFPWGIFGKGYVIDSPETKQKIRRFLQASSLISLVLSLFILIYSEVAIILLDYVEDVNNYAHTYSSTAFFQVELSMGIICVTGIFIWWYIGIQPFVKTLPTTAVKLTWKDTSKAYAKAVHPAFLGFGLIFFILSMFAGVLFIVCLGPTIPVVIGGLFFILGSGVGILDYIHMINVRNKP